MRSPQRLFLSASVATALLVLQLPAVTQTIPVEGANPPAMLPLQTTTVGTAATERADLPGLEVPRDDQVETDAQAELVPVPVYSPPQPAGTAPAPVDLPVEAVGTQPAPGEFEFDWEPMGTEPPPMLPFPMVEPIGTAPAPVELPVEPAGTAPAPAELPVEPVGTAPAPAELPVEPVGTAPAPAELPVEPVGTAPAAEEAQPAEAQPQAIEPAAAPTAPGSISLAVGALASPANVRATDTTGDYGGSINITWGLSADDRRVRGRVRSYLVFYQVVASPESTGQAEGEASEMPAEAEPPGAPGDQAEAAPETAETEWTFFKPARPGVTEIVFDQARRGYTYRFMVVAVGREVDDQVRLWDLPVAFRVLTSVPIVTEPLQSLDDLLLGDDGLHPGPPTNLVFEDFPWDRGEALRVSWTASEEDYLANPTAYFDRYITYLFAHLIQEEIPHPLSYDVLLRTDPDAFWEKVGEVPIGVSEYVFAGLSDDTKYQALVVAVTSEGHSASPELVPMVSPVANWYEGSRLYIGILGLIICMCILVFIEIARRGRKPFIRKIAGLEAIDEAIGRATEMGRPILYIPGIGDMDNVQTLAGLNILGHVAKTIAEYDTKIDIPVCRSLVMTAGREVVKQAYLQAGRPDAFDEGCCHYITDEQFGYVAGVDGIIVRDKPATCFFQGAFYAESLILAETGNLIGAIQIAGTAMPSQLPFFIAACDYTLIGEELFAASAYLSGDPKQLGSLKGQDMGKLLVMFTLVIGSLAATVAHLTALRFHSVAAVFNDIVLFLHRVFE